MGKGVGGEMLQGGSTQGDCLLKHSHEPVEHNPVATRVSKAMLMLPRPVFAAL